MRRPGGFAAMTPERLREVTRMGGKASAAGAGHKWTAGIGGEAQAAGRKGGIASGAARRAQSAQPAREVLQEGAHDVPPAPAAGEPTPAG